MSEYNINPTLVKLPEFDEEALLYRGKLYVPISYPYRGSRPTEQVPAEVNEGPGQHRATVRVEHPANSDDEDNVDPIPRNPYAYSLLLAKNRYRDASPRVKSVYERKDNMDSYPRHTNDMSPSAYCGSTNNRDPYVSPPSNGRNDTRFKSASPPIKSSHAVIGRNSSRDYISMSDYNDKSDYNRLKNGSLRNKNRDSTKDRNPTKPPANGSFRYPDESLLNSGINWDSDTSIPLLNSRSSLIARMTGFYPRDGGNYYGL
ncbi:hypothetical protein BDQ17DRAFT_1333044 [Cyathus striatus]|nr:hypothetical protein BDQ17DRAFT_1333044 [Cyathus striatus]